MHTRLTLNDSIENVRHFFDSALFPRVSDVGLTLENANEDGFQRLITSVKASCRNPARAGHPFNNKIRAFRFNDDPSGRDINLHPLTLPRTSPSLNVSFSEWDPTFEHLYSHLQAQYDFTELRRLQIGGRDALDVEQWKTLFGRLSKLNHIVFANSSSASLLALLKTLNESRTQNSDGQDAPPWFPALTKLECRDIDFSPGDVGEDKQVLIERLCGAVGHRSEQRPSLELHISSCRTFVADDEARIHRGVPNLKLVWDPRWDDF